MRSPKHMDQQGAKIIEWRQANETPKQPVSSEHQPVHNRLHLNTDLLASIIEANADGLALVDGKGHITFANRAAEHLLGLAHRRIPERNSPNPAGKDTSQTERSFAANHLPIQQVMDTGQPVYGVEYSFEHPNGRHVVLAINAAPLRDENGALTGIVASLRDISERKRAEETLRFLAEASALLSSSLDYHMTLTTLARLGTPHLADWCVVDMIEADGSLRRLAVAHVDPAKVDLGWAVERKYPFRPEDRFGPPKVVRTGQPEMLNEVSDAVLVEVVRDKEHLHLLRELGMHSSICAPLIARGRPLGTVTFVTAGSGRRYESADLALAVELAKRAALAIDNARLYQEAQESLRAQNELNQLKDLFLSIASHELRSPLTSIRGYAQMLKRSLLKLREGRASQEVRHTTADKTLSSLDTILRQTSRMNGFISQLLEFSRLQTGRLVLRYSPPANLIELVHQIVKQQATTSERELIVQVCEDTLVASYDQARVEQVLYSLLDNAIRYSNPGAIIRIGIERGSDKKEALIWVRDEGPGIQQDEQAKIFDQFYQIRNKQEAGVDGLGLSLYLSHEIIKLHGGRMWLQSMPGKGSTFYFTLPLAQSDTSS